jgi:hypothetical protein
MARRADNPELRAMRDRDRDRVLRMQLTSWHGIAVATFRDRGPRATLAAMDLATRRLKFSQLPEPTAVGDVVPRHLEALLQAAQEAVLAWGRQETLF